jgi:hypothetical protein
MASASNGRASNGKIVQLYSDIRSLLYMVACGILKQTNARSPYVRIYIAAPVKKDALPPENIVGLAMPLLDRCRWVPRSIWSGIEGGYDFIGCCRTALRKPSPSLAPHHPNSLLS